MGQVRRRTRPQWRWATPGRPTLAHWQRRGGGPVFTFQPGARAEGPSWSGLASARVAAPASSQGERLARPVTVCLTTPLPPSLCLIPCPDCATVVVPVCAARFSCPLVIFCVSAWLVRDSVGVLWGRPLSAWPWLPNRKHERTVHDKSRPFACDQCNRTFGEVSGRGEGWQRGTGGQP